MSLIELPEAFIPLREAAVAAIRRAYGINAEHYDPNVGDDAVVFGIGVYRNSWYMLEQEVDALEHWSSARPLGSLVLTGAGLRVHVYRHGSNVDVDLDTFRLDDARASATQRLIAESNTLQLFLPGMEPPPDEIPEPSNQAISELVIVHAGNPDDGCCGVWIGVPIASEEITRSPWAWIEPLWLADADESSDLGSEKVLPTTPRHDELPEPVIALEPVETEEAREL